MLGKNFWRLLRMTACSLNNNFKKTLTREKISFLLNDEKNAKTQTGSEILKSKHPLLSKQFQDTSVFADYLAFENTTSSTIYGRFLGKRFQVEYRHL